MVNAGAVHPGEQLVAAEATLGKGQQSEKGAAGDPRREWHHRGPVHRQSGGLELIVCESCVGLRFGEDQRDPIERSAVTYGVDDRTEPGAHLLVRVGHGDDPGLRRIDDVHRIHLELSVGSTAAEPLDRQVRIGVGTGVTGAAGDHHDLTSLGDVTKQCRAVERDPLRQVDEDSPEFRRNRMPFSEGLGSRIEQVLLVVPGGLERSADLSVQPDHVGRPVGLGAKPFECSRCQVTKLTVGRDERHLGGRVGGDRAEHARPFGECAPECRRDDRGGHGTATFRGQAGSPQQLAESVHGEEGDRGDTLSLSADRADTPRGEEPAGGDPHVV